jgi:N-acetyl-anhydromuramyl-L-alanine amidase AmpD
MRAALAALALVTPIPAAQIPAAWSNYSHHFRPASQVRVVVVHVTEGSYDGTISWFRNRHARAAANYVVARDGRIAHMVPNDRIAWHAGNSSVNYHSIGVEHEGYVAVDGTITDEEYRSSARLVASLLRRYDLPADRRHLIGHNEVPDPNHRGEYGGFAHHTDPGPHWDWSRYLQYVHAFRSGRTPAPRALDVSLSAPALGAHVTGVVPLAADVEGAPTRVDFLVDGVVRYTTSGLPYSYDWDTSLEQNGRHVLAARAVDASGRTAISATVVNSETLPAPPPVVTLPSLPPLTGVVTIQPQLSGGPVARVELWIDGVLTQTATAEPWALTWDVSTVTPGQHVVAVRAVGPRGRATAAIVPVVIEAATG